MSEQGGIFITQEEYERLHEIAARARKERIQATFVFWVGIGLGWLGSMFFLMAIVEKIG